jgi:biopolymer transport protein ExbB
MLPADLETWVRWLTFLPIVVASVVGLGLTLWKRAQLRRPNLPPPETAHDLREFLLAGQVDKARELIQGDETRGSQIVRVALASAGRSRDAIRDRVRQKGQQLAAELEYGMGSLALIATLGPLLGLFGTVVGIVLVFKRLAALQGMASPQDLAGGIGTALYTTIAGLIVGMLALVVHRYLAARIDRAVAELEAESASLIDQVCGEPE